MVTSDWTMGKIYLSQTITRISGNFSLLSHYIYLYFTECKFRSTDLIIKRLTVANCLVILSREFPQTMAALGMKHFLSDTGCKLVFYVHRVDRDVSICSTCLLSSSKAITTSPRLAELKAKAHKYIGPSVTLFWIVNLILNVILPVHVSGNRRDKNLSRNTDYGYCYLANSDRFTVNRALHAALVLFRDVFFVVLLLWSSSSMVFTLYSHKQQVQYIHRNNVSSKSSPEFRAHSILVLVSTFLSLFTLSSIFHICLAVLRNPWLWLVNTSTLITGSFSAVSPYILMSHDSRVPSLCCACTRNTQSPTYNKRVQRV